MATSSETWTFEQLVQGDFIDITANIRKTFYASSASETSAESTLFLFITYSLELFRLSRILNVIHICL